MLESGVGMVMGTMYVCMCCKCVYIVCICVICVYVWYVVSVGVVSRE